MLIVTGQGPAAERHVWRGDKRRRAHARPLGVEQDLEAEGAAGGHHDRHDGDTRVGLVDGASGERRVGSQTDGLAGRKDGACRRVEDLHLQRLAGKGERGARARGVDGDGRVGVHAPLDRRRNSADVVLDKHLATVIKQAYTTLDGPEISRSQNR